MQWVGRILLALWLPPLTAACSVAATGSSTTVPVIAATAQATASPTWLPSTKEGTPVLPQCKGMQSLVSPVNFDWPNLEQRKEEFISTAWQYFACDQPATEVATLYRAQLTKPPYHMQETNWLDRPEGTLGIYFSQSGLWSYIWFISQPNDALKSYLIVAESFASVEC